MYSNIGKLILRLSAGLVMLPHGYSKLEMLVNGQADSFMNPIGLGPTFSLILAMFAELICSILIILGFFTRPAAFILAINMAVATYALFSADKPFSGGMDFPVLFFGTFLSLIFLGGGAYAIDTKANLVPKLQN